MEKPPADPELAKHTQPLRRRGWADLTGGLALIGLVVAAGYFGYQWIMGDLPEARTMWPPMGLLAGACLGPIVTTLLGPRPGTLPNIAFGVVSGALAGLAIAGALAAI